MQRLVSGDEERELLLRVMAELAAAAGSVNPGSWSVSLHPRRISLNVGFIMVLRIGMDGLGVAADDVMLARLQDVIAVGASTFEFRVLAGVQFISLPLKLESLKALHEVSLHTGYSLVRRAAESDGPWRRAHSPAVVALLERGLGHPLLWRASASAEAGAQEPGLPGWIAHTERAEGLASGAHDDTRSFRLPATAQLPATGEHVFLFDGDTQQLWAIGKVEHSTAIEAPQGPETLLLLRVAQRLDQPLAADVIRQHPDLADLEILKSERPLVALAPKIARLVHELVHRRRAPRVVKIAVSNDYGVSWEECLARKEIRVGWDEVGDLRRFANKQQFKRAFAERCGDQYNKSPGTIGRKANELWTLRELQPGDRVVANRGMSEVLAVGEVLPEAYQYDDTRSSFKHIVRVEWDTSTAGKIQKQPYWGFTTVDDVSPELYSAIVSGEAEAATSVSGDPSDSPARPLPGTALAGHAPASGDETPPASGTTPPASPVSATFGAIDAIELLLQPWPTTSAEVLAQEIYSRDSLVFPPETISAFMLALQTRRFVILSGISGTGKTQLARVFADFAAKQLRTPRNVAIIPVRPDWTDHRGLLGCENVISGKYMATDAVRLMLDASAELQRAAAERRAPAPYFLILDEMNLARVEHYLADVLSAMESRQALSLHEHGEPLQGVPPRLNLPRNLCLIGTVNVDETTYMFSPKVLDRAFVLELSHIDLLSFGARPVTPRPDDLLLRDAPFSLVALDRTAALDWEQFGRMRQGSLRRMVTDLHDLLHEDGRGFGYRVAGELARFVALAEEFGCQSDQELTAALDLAILMKVLPRLHGAQQELERPLCRLLSFACTGADGRSVTELLERWRSDNGRLVSQADGTPARLPRTARKLHRMLGRLRQRGFVSYIE